MLRQVYPTIKYFKNMGLTEFQIEELIRNENRKHNFRNLRSSSYDIEPPRSIFFIDIKDTLYHSSGSEIHGVLGRNTFSSIIYLNDLFALGSLLDKTLNTVLTVHNVYSLNEKNMPRLMFDLPKNLEDARYKLDIPQVVRESLTGNTRYESRNGQFKVVFVSSEGIEREKNIITFLLLIYKINMAPNVFAAGGTGMKEIIKLEELFGKCDCDIDKFISSLPEEYKKSAGNIKEYVEKILSKLTFLSTEGTTLTKRDLIERHLSHYNLKNGLTYEDYNIFVVGDSNLENGRMVKLAYELGGVGYLTNLTHYPTYQSEDLRMELYEENGLEVNTPLTVSGFNDFYIRTINLLSLQRTMSLAETMEDVNLGREEEFNRLYKTNHYLRVKRLKK